jgi:hypothetical protein
MIILGLCLTAGVFLWLRHTKTPAYAGVFYFDFGFA